MAYRALASLPSTIYTDMVVQPTVPALGTLEARQNACGGKRVQGHP